LGKISPKALAAGLGFRVETKRRNISRGIGLGLLTLLIWHFLHGPQPEFIAYFAICVVTVIAVGVRVSPIYDAWRRTCDEQALLKLTPGWPGERGLKRLFMRTIIGAQVGAWLAWGALTVIAWLVGWVQPVYLAIGALIVLAGSAAQSGSLWALLASRKVSDELNLSSIIIFLGTGIGVVVFAVSEPSTQLFIKCALGVLAPAAMAYLTMMLRPIQFPANLKRARGAA
jgi:hypothetical protein